MEHVSLCSSLSQTKFFQRLFLFVCLVAFLFVYVRSFCTFTKSHFLPKYLFFVFKICWKSLPGLQKNCSWKKKKKKTKPSNQLLTSNMSYFRCGAHYFGKLRIYKILLNSIQWTFFQKKSPLCIGFNRILVQIGQREKMSCKSNIISHHGKSVCFV